MRVDKPVEIKKPEPFVPPQPLGKIMFMAILIIASTALFWLAWHNTLVTGINFSWGTKNVIVILTTLLAFCLMFCLMALAEILVSSRLFLLIIAVISSATVFVFFRPTVWSLVTYLLMVLGFLYWRREIFIDQKSRTKFIPQKTIDAGLKTAITIILLSLCFSYYSHLAIGSQAQQTMVDGLVSSGTRAVQNVLLMYYKDNYRPRMPLDDFMANLGGIGGEGIKLQTGQSTLDQAINEGLGSAQRAAVVTAREDFLKTFNISASGDEPMQSVVEKIVRSSIDKYFQKYVKFLPALLAISLFLILNLFNFIYRELIKSFGYLLFHILVWTKFIKVNKIQVEAEKISL